MLTANFLLSSSDYCLTLTKGKCSFVWSCMVSVAAFDELGNEEEDDEVISLHIGSDELFITPLSLVLRRYFQNMGEFILFILEILKTNKPFFFM